MVDKIITRQELVDAQKDAQTLEDVINGAPNVLIDTRLGRKVYTLASVPQINTMSRDEIEFDLAQKADLALLPLKADKVDTFTKTEVTGLIAPKADKVYVDTALSGFTNGASKFYATLAEANADIANITIKDKVEVGEITNGGTWYKATTGAVTLTKSAYDPLAQAKNYALSNPMFRSVEIPAGSDLNTYNIEGNFICHSKVIADTCINVPANLPAVLQVRALSTKTGYVYQTYQTRDSGSIFYRTSDSLGSFDSSFWRETANTGTVSNALVTAALSAQTKATQALVDAKAFANANKLFLRGLYVGSVDFNTLTANGEYLFRTNVAVTGSANAPTDKWGYLEVFNLSNSGSDQYVQKFTEGVSGATSFRWYGAVWSTWTKNPSQADIAVMVSASLDSATAYTNQYVEKTGTDSGIITHELTDANGKTMLSVYVDGGLKVVGLEDTVQDEIEALKNQKVSDIKSTALASIRTKKDTFTADAQLALNMQKFAQTGGSAPSPISSLYPQNYTINNGWVDAVSFTKPDAKIAINTPYRNNDGVVHPHIIEFYNGFRGYRYLMLLTPYYNTKEEFENPCIYGSNDLSSFTMLDGFVQPLADPPMNEFGTAHNSDPVFVHDPRTGELIVVWRETWRNWNNEGEVADAWVMRKTKDGYTFTDKEYLLGPYKNSTQMYTAAPAILYDPKADVWHVYIGTGAAMQHYVKKDLTLNGWELPATIASPSGFKPWHVDVRYVGNKIVALVHDQTNGQFRFGISSDFVNFTWATASNYGITTTDIYKATFLPKINASNQLAFDVIYTTRFDNEDIAKRWELYVTRTNFVDAGVTLL